MLSIVKSKQVKKNRIAQEIKKLHLLKQQALQEWEGNLIISVKTSLCLFVKGSCQQSYVLMVMLHNTELFVKVLFWWYLMYCVWICFSWIS